MRQTDQPTYFSFWEDPKRFHWAILIVFLLYLLMPMLPMLSILAMLIIQVPYDTENQTEKQKEKQTGWSKNFRFLENCNRFYLAIWIVCLLYFFMPMISMAAVLVSQISYGIVTDILAGLYRILPVPWQWQRLAQAFVLSMMYLKVFWANIGFLSAILPAADKYESYFQETACQNGRLKSSPLFYLDTVIKVATSVSAIIYGKLLFQASSWYVPSVWLYVCGFGVAMQGLLGLRLMLYETIDKLNVAYSKAKNEPEENLSFLQKMVNTLAHQLELWQKNRVGALFRHAGSEYAVMVVLSGVVAYIFPYAVVFPGWYLIVGVSCTMRLFKNIIQDSIRVIGQLWQVIWYRRYWEDGEYKEKTLVQGLRYWVRNCLYEELSLASMLRAVLCYFALLRYAAINPAAMISSLSAPAWIAIKVILRGGVGVAIFLLPYMIPGTIVAVLCRLDSKGDGIDSNSDEQIFNKLCKIFSIDNNSPLKAKVRAIYISFMQPVAYMLILSILYPVVPGLWPINALQKASAPFMKGVINVAWYVFSLAMAKAALDVLALTIANKLRKLQEPQWLCDAIEKSMGFAGLISHFCAKYIVVPSRVSKAVAAIASPVFRYTGMRALWSFMQMMARIVGITYLLSLTMNVIETWRVLTPLKMLLQMLGAITLDQWGIFLVANFVVTFGMILWGRVTKIAKSAFVKYEKIVEKNKAVIDTILNVIVAIALCAFLISLVMGVTKIAICLSAGMSWKASVFSLAGHLLGTGIIAYLAGYVIPMQIQRMKKGEDKAAQQDVPVASDQVRPEAASGASTGPPTQPGSVDPVPSAPPMTQGSGPYGPSMSQNPTPSAPPMPQGSEPYGSSMSRDPTPTAPPMPSEPSVEDDPLKQSGPSAPWGYGVDPQSVNSGF